MILIVDDDEGVREALRFSLATEGYAVRTFPDAESMLSAELPNEGCLVIDYRLPGMNGLSLIAKLRQRGVRLPAALITTHPRSEVRAQAAATGTTIIEKPLTGDALSLWLHRSLPKSECRNGDATRQ